LKERCLSFSQKRRIKKTDLMKSPTETTVFASVLQLAKSRRSRPQTNFVKRKIKKKVKFLSYSASKSI
jgi:hypothetical protein